MEKKYNPNQWQWHFRGEKDAISVDEMSKEALQQALCESIGVLSRFQEHASRLYDEIAEVMRGY